MIEYRINEPLGVDDIIRVFNTAGLNRPTQDRARMTQMFEAADLTVSAWDGAQLVGVARALTDFAYCCYLSDLAVDENYQHQGIGQELVQTLRSQLSEAVTLLLIAAPSAVTYYPKLGFEPLERGFVIRANR